MGGDCYDFSVHLARSESYLSRRRTDTIQTQFTQPIRLRIWGGNNYCDKREMLAETDVVEHTSWKKYDFKLKPLREYNFIMLEAFYMTPTLVAYNGNILIDNCSPITLAICKDEEPLIAIQEPVQEDRKIEVPPSPRDKPDRRDRQDKRERDRKSDTNAKKEKNKTDNEKSNAKQSEPIAVTPPPPPPPPPVKKEPTIEEPKTNLMPELKDKDFIKAGQTFQTKIRFPADSTVLTESSFEVLEEVFYFLTKNKDVSIEIGGHTNDIPKDEYCQWLSTERAENVANYLVQKGIPEERISAKGYGKTQPIASNKTQAGRNKNQRVEIKITSTGG